ncbi:MAG: hypothetical protein HY648_00825 [Acidobacteria bacterium]|nr:hypothetical protein [Acidobacteriota bacterium]
MGFWCQHRNQTTPRRDEEGEYRRCLDCGLRLPWSWADGFPILPPKQVQPPSLATLVRKPPASWKPAEDLARIRRAGRYREYPLRRLRLAVKSNFSVKEP